LILSIPGVGVREFGGSETSTTNNRMELFGFYRGLQEVYRAAAESNSKELRVISDSKYVLEGAEKNLRNWSVQGWKTRAGEDVKNRDLWEKVLKGQEVLAGLGFRLRYELVKGHAGSEVNERADQIAVRFSRGEPIELYSGDFQTYPVSFRTDEKFEPVYLSWVGGKLSRHRTWDECRVAVEGKAGARYKKVKNRLEERETLENWGVPRT
jgi:ribonuclease HI